MHITIKTYNDTRNMEVPQTESALYKAIGEQLLNLSVPNRLLVSTPVGEAEFDVKQRGTFAKDGTIYPSMYVTEEYNTIQLPQDTYPEAYLTCINPVSNNYKFYHFRPSGSVLNATYGRIGAGRGEAFGKKDLKTPYPIHLYWIRYYEKLSKGYKDESSIYLAPAVSETPVAPTIPDQRPEAIELYQKLYTYAKGMVERHLVHHDKVTVEQVSQSKKILAELSTKTTLKDFNETLQKLLTISPRKSRYVKSLLAVKTSDFPAIIDRENDLITAMEVMRPSGSIGSFREHNIHVFEATDSQRQEVIEHLTPSLQRKVRKIWRVIPDRQQKPLTAIVKSIIFAMYGRCGTEAGMQTGSVSRKIPSKSFPPMRMDACLVTELILPLIRTRVFCIQAVLLQNTQTNMKMLYIWGFLRLLTENHFMWNRATTLLQKNWKRKRKIVFMPKLDAL